MPGVPENQPVVITCIQEKWDNSRLTVRANGQLIGTILQDAQHVWVATPAPPPTASIKPTLQQAVEWLYAQSLEQDAG